MRALLFSLLLSLSWSYTQAEYTEWHLKLRIETKDGQVLKGYYRTGWEIRHDSAQNTGYLIKRLRRYGDSLCVYQVRLSYNNQSPKAVMAGPVYQLLRPKCIPLAQVKSASASGIEAKSYLMSFGRSFRPRDSLWMKQKPLRIIHASTPNCEYDFFIHEESHRLEELLRRFKQIADKYGQGLEYLPPDDAKKQEAIIKEIVDKGLRVVIISFCTC